MKNKRRTLNGLLLAAVVVSGIVSCGSMETRSPKVDGSIDTGGETLTYAKGVPYHLPTTLFAVSIESIRDEKTKALKETKFVATPHYVADPSHRFVLRSPNTPLFKRKHEISVSKGLLTSVSTTDESKIAEIVKVISSTVLTLQSGVPVGVGGTERSASPTEMGRGVKVKNPTPAEVAAALEKIAPGKHQFLKELDERVSENVPGTGSDLRLEAWTQVLRGAHHGLAGVPSRSQPAKSATAIFTRTTVPRKVTTRLELRIIPVVANRVSAAKKGMKEADAGIKELATEIATLQEKLQTAGPIEAKKLQSQIDAKGKARVALVKKRVLLNSEKLESEQALADLEKAKEDPYFTIGEQSGAIQVTDDGSVFAIAVKPAAFGTTKHTVTLVDGLVTDYSSERPSAALEIAKIPYDIASALVDIPGQLIARDSKQGTTLEGLETKRLANENQRLLNEQLRDQIDAAKTTPAE